MKFFPEIIGSPQFSRRKPGVGTVRAHQKKICVGFSEDDFETIRRLAQRRRISFAEQVRTLVEWGLEAK